MAWAEEHPGLYKVLHETTVHRKLGMPWPPPPPNWTAS
ncbi:TetR family transcriptional regulator [Nocardia seriolae]|nr:TetR family transcriptional regulator [Nocardia seriolae]